MAKMSIEIEGLDVLEKKVRSLLSAVESEDVEKALVKGAQIIRDAAKTRAPVREGALKRSLKAKKGKRRSKAFATAFAAADRKIAPHSHLVESGHSLVRGGKVVGHVPAHPFFRPAIDSSKGEVKCVVERGLKDLIEGAVR